MLSRIAESFYWIGRYTERAEATTRLLVEHHQLIVEDTRVPSAVGASVLLSALGLGSADTGDLTPQGLVNVVVGTTADPSTIVGAVSAARENARSVRDAVPGDLFEAMNNLRNLATGGEVFTDIPGIGLRRVLDGLAAVGGIAQWVNPRDEGHLFMELGSALERIDMMGRLLEIRHDAMWPEGGPATALRASGAFVAFLRTGAAPTGPAVREYLVLDGTFPRSMLHCSRKAEQCVRDLEREGVSAESSALTRTVGMLRSSLEYAAQRPTPEVVSELAEHALVAAFDAGRHVSDAFFRQAGTVDWSMG